MKELGLSCGTFNPIHDWHLIVAQCAADQFGLDKVLVIPNGTPPHKKNDVLDAESRWEMVVAAAATNPKFEACRIELDRKGPSYTLDTLTALKALYGDGVRLNLLIGVDNIEPIPRWYKADEIFKIVRLLIAPRLSVSMEQAAEMAKNLPAHCNWEIIDAPGSALSSTMIRDWIRKGRSVQYLVPCEVNRLLIEKGHYKAVPETATAPAPSTADTADQQGALPSAPTGGSAPTAAAETDSPTRPPPAAEPAGGASDSSTPTA